MTQTSPSGIPPGATQANRARPRSARITRENLPPWRLIREPLVIAATGYSRASLRRLAALGEFPSPLKLGTGKGGAVAWREDEILAWIEARQRGEKWQQTTASEIKGVS